MKRATKLWPAIALVAGMLMMGCTELYDRDNDGYDSAEDCHDANAAVNPDAAEICGDGMDNDCDLKVDGADSDCP